MKSLQRNFRTPERNNFIELCCSCGALSDELYTRKRVGRRKSIGLRKYCSSCAKRKGGGLVAFRL